MKTKLIIVAVLAISAVGANALISGSSHDFSAAAWNTGGQICLPCHTPHQALGNIYGPLWNHDPSAAVGTFVPYTSATFDPDGGTTIGQPGPQSLACLSCHDGTTGLDQFGGQTGAAATIGAAFIVGAGGDLTTEHPIGFDYTDGLDAGLHDPSTTASGIAGGTTIQADLLFADKLECASCHDVHNELGTAIGEGLLRVDNAASALCLTCHDK